MESGRARRWLGRAFVAVYLVSVTVVLILLAVIGEGLLAVWLGAIEAASVVTVWVVTRRPPAPRDGARTTRLGTPLDEGMPSGRSQPPSRAR